VAAVTTKYGELDCKMKLVLQRSWHILKYLTEHLFCHEI